MRRVYKIDTDITPEQDEIITNQLTEGEVNEINTMDNEIDVFDELNDEGKIINYFLCEERHLDIIQKIADKYNVNIVINDITEIFLNDVIKLDNYTFNKFKKEQLKKK